MKQKVARSMGISETKDMSHFEKFVTEGNEKADELAKEGALLDQGFMAGARAETMQQEREEVFAALRCAASFHCLVEEWKDCEELKPNSREKGAFVDQKREETMHRTEWCAQPDRYRCMRCGRGKQTHEDASKMRRTTILDKILEKWGRRHLGGHDLV